MKRITILILILCSAIFSFSQNDTLKLDKKKTDRFVIWLIPSAATNIYGIAIGPVGSEAICNRHYTKLSHGLNFQILGQGFFQTFYINKMKFRDFHSTDNNDIGNFNDTLPKRAIHNGLLISPFGTFTDQVNGISFSLWMSMGKKINGLSLNLLWNLYEQINGISIGFVNHSAVTKGIQIGIVNKTKKLRGFQFGLWNKNEKRSLPLINWNFKDNKSATHNR
ncbi:MAG: hypothetical protein K8R37_15190 [Bacteroidales bacterium]|nr:hypothetical protein [Bacteroidales bacterium]